MPGLTGEVANLIVSLKLDDRGFSGKLNTIGRNLGKLDSGLSQMGRGVGQVGSGLARLGTVAAAAAAGGLAAVVTTAASFEQAFTGVEKTVEGTDAQLAELEGTLRQMARTIPVSFEELSAIGEAGGALGVARDSLDDFIDVVARLSVSTNLTADTAATALGQLGTILHLTEGDYEDFADSLVALGNAGASTEDQIVALAARFAAAGNSAGLTKEEILAISSAVASMGIEVEAGGTALSQTFNGITAAIGTGSDEVNAFTDTLNISAAEFKERWTRDALGTFQAFLGELAKLDKYEQADVLANAGITGIRQTNAIMLMTQNLGFFGDQLDVARNATGALDKESQKFFDTTAGQWKVLQNNVRDAAATIGMELLPVTNELIKSFVGELNKPGTQAGIKAFAQDLAGGIRGLVNELKGTDFSGIISGMKLAAEVAKGAFDAFRSLPAPIQQLAIAALVANKVSGGAVGQIVKGLGNIALGGVKVGGGLAGLFGGRGASPANPMFVAVTNQIPGAAGAPAAAAGRSVIGTIAKFVLGPAAAVIIGAEIAKALNEPTIAPAREFEEEQFNAVVESKDMERIVGAIEAIEDQQNSDDILAQTALIASNIPFIGDALGNVGPKLDDQRKVLLAQLTAMGLTRAQAERLVAAQREQIAQARQTVLQTANIARYTSAGVGMGARQVEVSRSIAARVSEQRSVLSGGFAATTGYLSRVAAKDFSPTVNLTNITTVKLGLTALQTQVVRTNISRMTNALL